MKRIYCYVCDCVEWHYYEGGAWVCIECHEPKWVE